MPKLNIPLTPNEITPEWLTEALRSTGTITKARVESVAVEPLVAGQGYTTQLAKLKVGYSEFEVSAPKTLFCKLPTLHEPTFILAKGLGIYEREVRFYEELSDKVPMRTARRYFSRFDADTDKFVLLLEDLSPARPGDQVAGCSLGEAELAVTNAALMHSSWWNSPHFGQYPWLVSWGSYAGFFHERYGEAWQKAFEILGSQMPRRIIDLCERIGPHVASIRNQLGEPPQTLVHIDYRLDNFMFGTSENDFEFAVVDWQGCRTGNGMSDVAYFVSGALDPEIRRQHENHLLELYYSTLVANGVIGYSFEKCVYDYRLAMLERLPYLIVIFAIVDMSSERARLLVDTWFMRLSAALADNNVEELIPRG